MSYYALISPRGCVEYNAQFVLGDCVKQMIHGKWYTNEELGQIAGRTFFLRDSAGAVEKNIKKWRFEIQS